MMRLTMAVWWSLALVWLLTSQVDAEPAQGNGVRRIEKTASGLTPEDAKKHALQEVTAELHAFLRKQGLSHWQPSEDYVRTHLVEGPGRLGQDLEEAGIPAKTWTLTVNLPDDEALQRLERQAIRQERAEERIRLALPVVAALALLLGVIVGGIRVDEWTHSRYTHWLRAAGAALITAIAVAWWYLR